MKVNNFVLDSVYSCEKLKHHIFSFSCQNSCLDDVWNNLKQIYYKKLIVLPCTDCKLVFRWSSVKQWVLRPQILHYLLFLIEYLYWSHRLFSQTWCWEALRLCQSAGCSLMQIWEADRHSWASNTRRRAVPAQTATGLHFYSVSVESGRWTVEAQTHGGFG